MVITELIKELVTMTVVSVSDLAIMLFVPLVLFMLLIAMKVDFVLGVLVVWIFLYCHGFSFCRLVLW